MSASDRLHDLLLHHILAGRRSARSIAVILTVTSGLVLLIPEHYFGPGWSWTLKLTLAGCFFALAGGFLLPALRPPEKHPVLDLVRRRPGEIVWVYVEKQTHYGAPVSAQLVLGLSSGKRLAVDADLGREHELLRAVGSVAPAATLGYEPAHAAAFRTNPTSLRR